MIAEALSHSAILALLFFSREARAHRAKAARKAARKAEVKQT
jgi:hypothetical protein